MRIVATVFLIFLLVLVISSGQKVFASDFELDIKSAILIEAETGQVLYEKNADEKLPPASLTKIMTMLLAMEKVKEGTVSLDDKINISKFAESMGGSQIFLAANTRVKFSDLMEAVAIASANDASVAIAETIGGSYSNFVNLMNKRADELGMENTYFSNSTGLPAESDHHTTARDVTKMARELVRYPRVLEWTSTWVDYIELPDRRAMLANTNKLINKYPGMDGLKTGHTEKAGFCLAATAERGMRLISVVMKGESEQERQELTTRLLDYGFNRFNKKITAEKGQLIHNIEIPEGEKIFTTGKLVSDLKVVVKRGNEEDLETKVKLKDPIKPPIKKGEILGRKSVLRNGKIINSVEIAATEDIERANIVIRLWRSFKKWILNLFGKNIEIQ
uniref:serine-type D-Ala-D-Ala carboxypeptidase n=1 Tax=uncultured organism TaxID=155900 RepID=M1PWH9_9ZZZZ|nr:serine-type D-Ala-D-Ala carboxypeptidase [uncultured organism]